VDSLNTGRDDFSVGLIEKILIKIRNHENITVERKIIRNSLKCIVSHIKI